MQLSCQNSFLFIPRILFGYVPLYSSWKRRRKRAIFFVDAGLLTRAALSETDNVRESTTAQDSLDEETNLSKYTVHTQHISCCLLWVVFL